MKKNLIKVIIFAAFFSMIGCTTSLNQSFSLIYHQSKNEQPALPLHAATSPDSTEIWNKLQHTSLNKLQTLYNRNNNFTEKAWIELAIISKKHSCHTATLTHALLSWRKTYPFHPANLLFPENEALLALANSATPAKIAILLPKKGPYAKASMNIRKGFLNAYYASTPFDQNPQRTVKFYDTSTGSDINTLYQQALSEKPDFILGPLSKEDVQKLSQTKIFLPTLALNYLTSEPSSPLFYQFGLLPEDEVREMADHLHHAGFSKVLLIAQEDGMGKRMAIEFKRNWQLHQGTIADSLFYSTQTNLNTAIAALLKIDTQLDKEMMLKENNKNLLAAQRRQDFDVILLFAKPREAHLIVPLLKYYYSGNIPIYAASTAYSKIPNPKKDADLDGIFVCDIPWSIHLWKGSASNNTNRLYALGQDAYLLSANMERLEKLNNFPIYSATGALTLSSNHQIHRRLPCIEI